MPSRTDIHINHGVGFNQHHLEWCPKYRHDVMDAKIAEEMKQILLQIAAEKGIIVHKMIVRNSTPAHSSRKAKSGPTTAPSMSPARSSP